MILRVMESLNKSEKKVLTILEQDSRLPASQIARKTLLSPEGVLKIIKKLENKRIILKYNSKINYSKIGYRIYPVHIRLNHLNKEVMKKIKDKIKKHGSCAWYVFCEGEYDLLLSFKIFTEKEKEDMDALLREISDYILEKEVSLVLNAFEISKSFIDEKAARKIFSTFDYNLDKEELSKKEFALIDVLKLNSREKIINIADELKIAPKSTISNIRGLIKKEIISGFKTKLNMAMLGYQPCIALIATKGLDNEKYNKLLTHCKYTKGIHYLVRQIGKYDFELTFDVRNINEFYTLIDNLRNKFDFITKITTLTAKL